jgi:hypothetical protein
MRNFIRWLWVSHGGDNEGNYLVLYDAVQSGEATAVRGKPRSIGPLVAALLVAWFLFSLLSDTEDIPKSR